MMMMQRHCYFLLTQIQVILIVSRLPTTTQLQLMGLISKSTPLAHENTITRIERKYLKRGQNNIHNREEGGASFQLSALFRPKQ